MVNRDIGLEYQLEDRKRKLAKLEERIKKIDQKIAESVDFEDEEKYEIRKDNIFNEISGVAEEIEQIKEKLQQKNKSLSAKQSLAGSLLNLLERNDGWLDDIQQAYQAAVSHWPNPAPQDLKSLSAIVTQLERMGQCQAGYSALESFIAHLVDGTNNLELITALNQLGRDDNREYDWAKLYAKIQDELTQIVENFKPAILLSIHIAEQETTQSENKPHYRLAAWLIEDIETYQSHGKQRTGYHSLISTGTPAAETFLLEELDAKIQPLLNQWIKEAKRLLVNCKNDPEFYVFLPKALLPLAVDYWPLDADDSPSRLGHLYRVIVCCSDRIEGIYPVRDWHDFWEKHETYLGRKAKEVFVGGNHQDIDSFIDALEEDEDAENIVGWKVNTPPCSCAVEDLFEEFKDLFEELLIMGLPLAIWGRCNETDIDNSGELDKLLQNPVLGQLPEAVQRQRFRARRRSPDSHIGHHLSLLRDNPHLIPPIAFRSA